MVNRKDGITLPTIEEIESLQIGHEILVHDCFKFSRLADTKTGKHVYRTTTLLPRQSGSLCAWSGKMALANALWFIRRSIVK